MQAIVESDVPVYQHEEGLEWGRETHNSERWFKDVLNALLSKGILTWDKRGDEGEFLSTLRLALVSVNVGRKSNVAFVDNDRIKIKRTGSL